MLVFPLVHIKSQEANQVYTEQEESTLIQHSCVLRNTAPRRAGPLLVRRALRL